MRTSTKVIVVYICDGCGSDNDTYPSAVCLSCDKAFCFNCGYHDEATVVRDLKQGKTTKPIVVKKYNLTCWSGGSGDGIYCVDCDKKLTQSREDKVHNAYVAVLDLKNEHDVFFKDWKVRADKAQAVVEAIWRAREAKN